MSSKTCSTKYPGLQIDEQLCLKLHRASNRFYGRYDRLLRSHGLTFSEYIVLVVVWERGPVSEGELARQLQFDPYTLEDTMLSLERRRLIQRHADPGRESYAMVVATPASFELQPALEAARAQFLCDSGLPDADWRALGALLDKMSAALAGMELDHLDVAAAADLPRN